MAVIRGMIVGLALVLLVTGVWVVSSMATIEGWPRSWVLAAGALCFPALPALWTLLAARGRGGAPRSGWFVDLAARTALLNLLVVGGLLGARPDAALVAVSTRGDWFLDEVQAPWGARARGVVLDLAEGLATLYGYAVGNPYEEAVPEGPRPPAAPRPGAVAVTANTVPPAARTRSKVQPTRAPAARPPPAPAARPPPTPAARPAPTPAARPAPTPPSERRAPREDEPVVLTNRGGALRWEEGEGPQAGLSVVEAVPVPEVRGARDRPRAAPTPVAPDAAAGLPWPQPGGPHPQAAALPDSATRSVEGLAAHLRAHTSEPVEQLRILHDWLATHVEYDDVSADTAAPEPMLVLERRKAVCAGFARVFHEVAVAVGLRSTVIVGRTRDPAGDLRPVGHAWNAVEVEGAWYLVDATWDVTRWTSGKTQPFSTRYLFAPPDVFRVTHLPELPAWQLIEPPLGLAGFLRQPMCNPGFFANGLRLRRPARAHLSVRGEVTVEVDNPRGRFLTLTLQPVHETDRRHRPCAAPIADARAQLRCRVPRHGEHRLALWAGSAQTGSRGLVARWRITAE